METSDIKETEAKKLKQKDRTEQESLLLSHYEIKRAMGIQGKLTGFLLCPLLQPLSIFLQRYTLYVLKKDDYLIGSFAGLLNLFIGCAKLAHSSGQIGTIDTSFLSAFFGLSEKNFWTMAYPERHLISTKRILTKNLICRLMVRRDTSAAFANLMF